MNTPPRIDRHTHRRFLFKRIDELEHECAAFGLELPKDSNLSVLSEPLRIGRRVIPNRFVAHPMEGFDSETDGSPGELSFRRYIRYARGGFGLIWAEATAVLHEG
ncbi:MAG: NADH:flavin oxidoreductase, partial [Chitinivibrionales bacterium]|nr:NADH:flavin oxidoreductase [Chitinivibrionales bacterium]